MFKFIKDLSTGCITLVGYAIAVVVGFELGGKVVDKINNRKNKKEETPENAETQN